MRIAGVGSWKMTGETCGHLLTPVVASWIKPIGKYVAVYCAAQRIVDPEPVRACDVSWDESWMSVCVNNPTLCMVFSRKINFDRRKKFYNLKLSGD